MEIFFFNVAGDLLFIREDIEEGHWIQENLQVTATYPFDPAKMIELGMRLGFVDPATGVFELFEVRNVTNTEPEHYQQITAESVALAELQDEHMGEVDLLEITAADALGAVLVGTLWTVGNVPSGDAGISSAEISRGSVWDAICTIKENWNVYINPRITLNSNGSINHRYLDITPAEGVWRGVYLSVDKNFSDPTVTYDDTETLTALYGYGANVDDDEDEETEEVPLTFADIVWTQTSSHPAKPSGQTYIEDPEATALYGRNGRPRFGYYQNSDIDDAATLLERTWQTLKTTNKPKIQIAGTAADLHRLGYADQPMRLHDTAWVEIRQTGEKFQKEIIQLDVDLVDPTGNRPTIGDYIPNIVHITKDTNDDATESSSGGGGGGSRGDDNSETEKKQYIVDLDKTESGLKITASRLKTVDTSAQNSANILSQAGLEIDANTGVLVYHTDNANMWKSQLNVQANRISLVVQGTGANASIKAAEIVASINSAGSTVKIAATHIELDGTTTAQVLNGETISVAELRVAGISDIVVGGQSIQNEIEDLAYDQATYAMAAVGLTDTGAGWTTKTVVTDVSASRRQEYLATTDSAGNINGYVHTYIVTSISPTTESITYWGK